MLLVNYLRAPEPTRWKQSVFTALFGLFDQLRMLSDALRADFDDAATALPARPATRWANPAGRPGCRDRRRAPA